MSNFLQRPPRRLPVALAHYVAIAGEDEAGSQRRAIATRIYATLLAEQQAEIGRICEAMRASGRRAGARFRGTGGDFVTS